VVGKNLDSLGIVEVEREKVGATSLVLYGGMNYG